MTLHEELAAALGELADVRLEPVGRGAIKVSWVEGKHRLLATVQDARGALVIVAGICLESQAAPRRVLVEALRLTGGCVALAGERYILRHVLPGHRREAAALREAVIGLAAAARDMARRVLDDDKGGDEVVFDHYVG